MDNQKEQMNEERIVLQESDNECFVCWEITEGFLPKLENSDSSPKQMPP